MEIIYKIEIKIKLIKVIININFKYIGNNKFIIILKFELNKLIKIIKINKIILKILEIVLEIVYKIELKHNN